MFMDIFVTEKKIAVLVNALAITLSSERLYSPELNVQLYIQLYG